MQGTMTVTKKMAAVVGDKYCLSFDEIRFLMPRHFVVRRVGRVLGIAAHGAQHHYR